MTQTLRYYKSSERPAVKLWLFDDDGTLIDYSTGSPTFSLKIGTKATTALLTKTSGITGAAGSGVEPTGTPNVTVSWTAGELAIAAGTYEWQLTITVTALDRVFGGTITILDTIA